MNRKWTSAFAAACIGSMWLLLFSDVGDPIGKKAATGAASSADLSNSSYGDQLVFSYLVRAEDGDHVELLRLSVETSEPAVNRTGTPVPALRLVSDGDPPRDTWFVDLATREAFRRDRHEKVDETETSRYSEFDPALGQIHPVRLLALQGSTVRTDRTLGHADLLEVLADLWPFLSDPRVNKTVDVARVEDGVRDGVRVRVTAAAPWSRVPEIPRSMSVVMVVAAGLPFPIHMEYRATVFRQGSVEVRQKEVLGLESYRLGSSPVAWLNGSIPAAVLEYAGGNRFPVDGTGFTLAFGLDAARAAVDADASLAQFHAWRRDHPSSRLVAARFGHTGAAPTHYAPGARAQEPQWELVFGDPAGGGYVVQSVEQGASGVVVNSASTAATKPFKDEVEPPPLLTLAAAERLWRQAAPPEYRSLPTNLVQWSAWRNPHFGVLVVGGPGSNQVLPFGDLRIGHYDSQGATRIIYEGNTITPHRRTGSELRIDPIDGVLIAVGSWVWETKPGGQILQQGTQAAPGSIVAIEPVPGATSWLVTGAAAILGGLGLFQLLRLLVTSTLGGHAKLRKARTLEHPMRDRIFDVVGQQPGLSASELHKAVGGGWTTLTYHLNRLERNAFIFCVRAAHGRRYFPASNVSPAAARQEAVLRHPPTRRVWDASRARPGLGLRALARAAGVSAPTALRHVRRLSKVGLLDSTGAVRRRYMAMLPGPRDPPRTSRAQGPGDPESPGVPVLVGGQRAGEAVA